MRITILDDYQDAVRKLDCFQKLTGHDIKIFNNTVKGTGQLAVRLRDAESLVLIRDRTAITPALLDKLPHLKLIVQAGRVTDHVDVEACTDRGVAVAEGVSHPYAPAEFTWALIMSAMRRLPQYISNLKHGAWQQAGLKSSSMPPNFGVGQVLRGKTLGIWGYGRIGKLVAGFGKAFGMDVLIWGSEAARSEAIADGFVTAASQAALFQQSDILSLHLRLSERTRGILKMDDLLRMKPTALFVNTASAELIESEALVLALNRGRPGMAAVDVFETEPILQGHPLLRMENVICTPHVGFVERKSYEEYFTAAFDNIVAFENGNPTNILNTEVIGRRRFAYARL